MPDTPGPVPRATVPTISPSGLWHLALPACGSVAVDALAGGVRAVRSGSVTGPRSPVRVPFVSGPSGVSPKTTGRFRVASAWCCTHRSLKKPTTPAKAHPGQWASARAAPSRWGPPARAGVARRGPRPAQSGGVKGVPSCGSFGSKLSGGTAWTGLHHAYSPMHFVRICLHHMMKIPGYRTHGWGLMPNEAL